MDRESEHAIMVRPAQRAKGNLELKAKILEEVSGGTKRNFLELLSVTNSGRNDLVIALEDLMSEGLLLRTSDGFVTVYAAKSRRPADI